MTNFSACNEYRDLLHDHGTLVPELAAHHYAGIGRQRWNELIRDGRVPVVHHCGVPYVTLAWIEQRPTKRGRRGYIPKSDSQPSHNPSNGKVTTLFRIPQTTRSNHSYKEIAHKKNGSNIPSFQKQKLRNTHAKRVTKHDSRNKQTKGKK